MKKKFPYCKKHKEYYVGTGSSRKPYICLGCEEEKLMPKIKEKIKTIINKEL